MTATPTAAVPNSRLMNSGEGALRSIASMAEMPVLVLRDFASREPGESQSAVDVEILETS